MAWDMMIKDGECVMDESIVRSHIFIKNGKIGKISPQEDTADEIVDAAGLHVLPGIIDSQVHFREPGLTHKEDLAHGSRAAVLGGVTTFLEMPNTVPPTVDEVAINQKVEIAQKNSFCNFGFFIGANGENLDQLKNCLHIPSCCGIKIFLGSSTGSLLLYKEDKLEEIFSSVSAPVAVHSEDEELLKRRIHIHNQGKTPHDHLVWRDEKTALNSTIRVVNIARKKGKKLHILHVTTKEEMEFLAPLKEYCSVEVTPQHLTFKAPDCYDQMGTYVQMNPPIRTQEHREGLWEALRLGVVDVVASDHAPHTKDEKEKGYPHSPSGMPGVQTLLPIMLDHVSSGRLSLVHLVKLICANPAKIYGLKGKGRLKEGFDGDITLVDLKRKHILSHKEMASKCAWTPFDGKEVTGMPKMTIMAGNIVMKEGKVISPPRGRPVVLEH